MCFVSVAATVVLIARDFKEETLLCRAEGNPTPVVIWTGPDGEVKKTSTVEARISLRLVERGKHTCMATNSLGSSQKSYTRKYFVWPVSFLFFLFYCRVLLLYVCMPHLATT